ncbi:MAG: AAA family ATPase [Cyanobacteria bacterium]|nr:AAA family ATPase [Cyanobacteriota bacterium]
MLGADSDAAAMERRGLHVERVTASRPIRHVSNAREHPVASRECVAQIGPLDDVNRILPFERLQRELPDQAPESGAVTPNRAGRLQWLDINVEWQVPLPDEFCDREFQGALRRARGSLSRIPTSRAAHKLAESGIESSTLQRHLARGEENSPATDQRRLYVLDESSLASTKQMHTFLERFGPEDRVLLVGDVRQHEAVDAGRPYRQLQEAGIQTARLDGIVRQKDQELKAVVEQLSRGEVQRAVEQLDRQGRVHEIGPRNERLEAIANEYVKDPHSTLVVSPDNQSRQELNGAIHRAMQSEGHVDRQEHRTPVLVPRNEITGTDRQWAERYEVGDVVRYSHGSKTLGIHAGDYARVEHVDARENRLTVGTDKGTRVTYDPRRLQGVTLYRETERAFSAGDRVQMTAPDRERGVANRELGTIERIRQNGRMEVRWDSGRTSSFEPSDRTHLDYGYAMTSHSSQGQTTGRVLVHVETDRASEKLVNQRLAYVAVSRGQHDARIYTDDKVKLGRALNREVSHRSALEHKSGSSSSRQRISQDSRGTSVGHAVAISR